MFFKIQTVVTGLSLGIRFEISSKFIPGEIDPIPI
jgi:hypothetical protein